ncbi:hypothetical protein LTR08_008341 [Meristemomyces frigidus]|nr:hypothetical protein LTR08_008341 [Meristemomyces frigidus]
MNGDPAFDTSHHQHDHLEAIRQALAATLDPRIPNDVRQQALRHLEQVKQQPDAPHYGFTLAEDHAHNDAQVRYYGLQLLEHAVRYQWSDYGEAQTAQLRTWVQRLASTLREREDPAFLRNKVAQLWVEVAKRCWGEEWMDMDAQLVALWEGEGEEGRRGWVDKVFVLYVLETLSEDVIVNEDAIAGLRMEVLGASLNEIVVPWGLYEEHAKGREGRGVVRCGEEGWLVRICAFFAECVKQARVGGQEQMSACAVKALNALRPTMSWVSLKGAVEANCIDCLFLPFHTDDVALETATTDTLHALLSRPHNTHWHDAWTTLMQQALRPDRVAMIRHTYDRTAVRAGEDDAKHTLQKKLSDLLSVLADAVAQHASLTTHNNKIDLPALFDLLLHVLQSKSLVVSIPVLHSWSKMMCVEEGAIIDLVYHALGTLVQTCSERLLRYEFLPSESVEDEVQLFLDEDFDTIPERHTFLGNYRRYCTSIIQAIGRSRPLEALQHTLEQMRRMLQEGPYTGGQGFASAEYSKTSLAVLQFDAQFNVVASALRGFSAWCIDTAALGAEDPIFAQAERDKRAAERALQEWSYGVIGLQVDDPEVAAMVLQTLVVILRTIKPAPTFVLHVVQHLLTMRLDDNAAHTAFSESVKAFEGLRVLELQQLALIFANELLEVYQELEPRIEVLAQKTREDPRLVWGYRGFLFMIIHRATGIEHGVRMERLQLMLKPVYEAWQAPGLSASVGSLHAFCEALGLGDIAAFYEAYGFDRVADWGAQQLDEAGQARQDLVKLKNEQLPLRMTKSMLAATTEKLKSGSEEYETACALWGHVIPLVLPNLLQMLRHAQAYHNPASWLALPSELQAVIRRTLQDRFWQSGISNETKEQFYARIGSSKASYEGFASVVRGTWRNIREQGYHVIYLMTKFDEQFYGLPELARPLAEALFEDAEFLSANHLHPIINLTTALVQRCPPHHRAGFLPPLLEALFRKMDGKISAEWEVIGAASEGGGGGAGAGVGEEGELGDEMRMESVLRQLTYSMVAFVPFLLEFDRVPAVQQGANGTHHAPPPKPTLSELVLASPTVLEPLILFCTHALRMRDTRCCVTICKVFRSIVPLFQSSEAPAPQVREFICTEVLKACITSINEPYFADMQKDLAALVAQIVLLYSRQTGTPREVLLSLPEMSAGRVDRALAKMGKAQSERQQRALVLELLEGVRGVGIYEAGRIAREAPRTGRGRGGAQERFMEVEQAPVGVREGEEMGLEAIADLFGEL